MNECRPQETFHITIVIRLLGNLLYAIVGGLGPLDHADKVHTLQFPIMPTQCLLNVPIEGA
jgi:hypothetical protein